MNPLAKMTPVLLACVYSLLTLGSVDAWGQSQQLPAGIPDSLGISVHWRGEIDGTHAVIEPISDEEFDRAIEEIKASGLRLIRTDIAWRWTDRENHEYDFEPHARLLERCEANGLRLLTIVTFRDHRHEDAFSVRTQAGRDAYAAFCAAAAKRFKGRGIIWELWNEPNLGGFWGPKGDATEYTAMARQAIAAMREADPDCLIVGPTTATFDWPFLKTCFDRGLLDGLTALSIHPYCDTPESVLPRYLRLREMMGSAAPDKSSLPIVFSEWGFSRLFVGKETRVRSEMEQARLVARSLLVGQMCGVAAQVLYTNHDYTDKLEWNEDSFGFIASDGRLKPAFHAVQTLTSQLAGTRYDRLMLAYPPETGETTADDYVAVFTGPDRTVAVAWSTREPHESVLQLPTPPVSGVDMLGAALKPISTIDFSPGSPFVYAKLMIGPEPIYIELEPLR